MVLDVGSKKLVDGAVKEDDILKENVTSKLDSEDGDGNPLNDC